MVPRICTVFVLILAVEANAQELLVSAFDKAAPETRQDLLTIQRAVVDAVEKATPCTVGLRLRQAMGSGVIISEDGYILTAAHVVSRPGRTVTVLLPDGREAEAKSLGLHTSADGALLKMVDEGPWPFVPLADADEGAKIGDWCIALGHPDGFDPKRPPPVRVGRVIDMKSTVLRTDCPITSGDSGGPLIDVQGRVIGIHSRITESITENFHVPSIAYREAWDAMVAGEIYPQPIPSQFLALLDTNEDGQLTRDELATDYHRRLFDRLVEAFELDTSAEISIQEVVEKKFGWKPRSRIELDDLYDLQDSDNLSLASDDFVRGSNMRRLFQQTLAHANQITVRVYSDGRRVALGTVVGADGLVLTKASRLDDERLACLMPDGSKLPSVLVARDDEYDLGLLRVDASQLETPNWSTSLDSTGSWVSIPNTAGRLESIGVVAVAPRLIAAQPARLGVIIDPEVVNEAVIVEVGRRSGAEAAGLEVGDVILEVAGQAVKTRDDIVQLLEDYRAGDTVTIAFRRDGNDLDRSVVLRNRTDIDTSFFQADRRMSGRLSRRRDGFGSAFQLDAVLKPELCGGPVVDVNGKIVGVTLARASRVASYAISSQNLQPVIQRLRRRANEVLTGVTKDKDYE